MPPRRSALPVAADGPIARIEAGARRALAAGLCLLALNAGAQPTPCRLPDLETEALCGSVRRPLDPQRGGATIDVHYAVLPALARNKQPDPVFFFAGGPGQSAIDLAGPLSRLLARLNNRRDVVLIDQRGTGRSAPLACEAPAPVRPLAESLDAAAQQRWLDACRQRLQQLPHGDLRQYTTTIAMHDADAVRAALGVERLNAVGASYGTRAVLEYLRLYPQRVRRAVLDGVVPPDMALVSASAPDNQRALDALLEACAAEAACAKRHPALAADWQALLQSLPRDVTLRHPVSGTVESLRLTRDALLGLVRQALYSPVLASALPLAIEAAGRSRFEPLMALGASLGGGRRAPAQGMHFSVICAEDRPQDAGTAPAGTDFGDSFAGLYRRICADWPRGEVPSAFHRVAPAATPVWLLSGGIDPVTPPRHGQRIAEALGAKARHTVVANAAHGVLAIGCVRDLLFRFVDAPTDAAALALDAGCVERLPRPPAFVLPEPGR